MTPLPSDWPKIYGDLVAKIADLDRRAHRANELAQKAEDERREQHLMLERLSHAVADEARVREDQGARMERLLEELLPSARSWKKWRSILLSVGGVFTITNVVALFVIAKNIGADEATNKQRDESIAQIVEQQKLDSTAVQSARERINQVASEIHTWRALEEQRRVQEATTKTTKRRRSGRIAP